MNKGVKILIIIVVLLAVLGIAGYFAWPFIANQINPAPANTNVNVPANVNANANANVNQSGGSYSESTSNLPENNATSLNVNNEPTPQPENTETTRPDVSQYSGNNIKLNADGSVRTVNTDPATDLDKDQMEQAVREFMPNYFNFNDLVARKQYLSTHLDLGYINEHYNKNIFRYDVATDYRESLFVQKDWLDITWSEPIAMVNYAGGAYCQINIDHTYVNPGDDGAQPHSHRISDCYYVYVGNDYKITDMKRITSTEL